MIISLKHQVFIDFLIDNECEVVCDKNWNDYNRIMMKKGDITFPIQMQDVYYYYTVNKICDDLGIEPPEDCKKVREQIRGRKKGDV
ncbi:MAG: hypothetical protein V4548_02075 [Bacteroidota bacterium]